LYPAKSVILVLFAVALAIPLCGADRRRRGPVSSSSRTAASIKSNVRLTLVPVSVTDPRGAPYRELPEAAFHVLEDGVPQEIRYFSFEDAPLSLGIVFDASRSMEGKLDESRAAVSQFLQTSGRDDEYFLVEFSDAPRMLNGFTRSTDDIERALVNLAPKSWTALYDAVYRALTEMKHARNTRKALLVLSDGGDNYSRYSEAEMRSYVREADVCIYAIGLVSGGLLKRHSSLLRGLAEETGGHFYPIENVNELPAVIEKISAAIRNSYVLGYHSTNPNADGKYRKIQVQVEQRAEWPRLRATWRSGYYSPDE
jgi:VWFA-related protein